MATRDPRGRGQFDRRVTLLKPVQVEFGPDNPYNENDVTYQPEYTGYPAKRFDASNKNSEGEEDSVVRAISVVEWSLVYTPGLNVKANWRLRDEMDGQEYQITVPMTENGRGISYRLITTIVQ